MPPRDRWLAAPPAIASISGVIAATIGRCVGDRGPCRAARCRARRRRDSRTRQSASIIVATRAREAVVVAVADFGRRDGVVLVDDRHRAEAEQRRDRGARVEEVAPLLGDVGRDEDLAGDDAVPAEALGPGLAQRDLAGARRGLALLERQVLRGEPEEAAAERDGAGRDDDDRAAVGLERRDIGGRGCRASRCAACRSCRRRAAPSRS